MLNALGSPTASVVFAALEGSICQRVWQSTAEGRQGVLPSTWWETNEASSLESFYICIVR
jgi:hypothetical protein